MQLVALGLSSSLALASVPTVVSIAGNVRLEDGGSAAGVSVTLMFDLNDDGAISAFEQATAETDANGAFSNAFKPDLSKADLDDVVALTALLDRVASDGFAALIDKVPRALIVKFAKQGYAPVYKRLSLLNPSTTLDVVLRPLAAMACGESTCLTPGGDVELRGLTRAHGIEGAAARAFSPTREAGAFPGAYASSDGAMLVTSGFFDMQLTGSGGAPLTSLPTPVAVRQKVPVEALHTLIDATPGSGAVEITMFSFDAEKAVWQAEANARLEDEDGAPITEEQLATVQKGELGKDVLVSFNAPHMSYWNIDRALNDLACVRGRLVTEDGTPMAGAFVEIGGVSYLSWGSGLIVGDDGVFAGNVVRSELGGEDVNGNGVTGETFQVRIFAKWNGRTLLGEPFDTPTVKSTTANGSAALQCLPAACDCVDIGDVKLDALEPRMCEITVTAKASGKLTRLGKEPTSRPAVESAASGLFVSASASIGNQSLDSSDFTAVCTDPDACGRGTTDANGVAKIQVPVAGAEPVVELSILQTSTDADGDVVFATGFAKVTGCVEGEISAAASVEVGYGSYKQFKSFMAGLPELAAGGTNSGDSGDEDKDKDDAEGGCGCTGSVRAPAGLDLAGALLLLPLGLAFRRRRR